MSTVTSRDGTKIAYDRRGSGSPVILVDGALCFRSFGPMPELANQLAAGFTVFNYDRRGRGESGDNLPFSVSREVEDIDALVAEAGGAAYVFGVSSGACLALEAAIALGPRITRLAMYEPPYVGSESSSPGWREYRRQLASALAAGRRGDAVELFMRRVGTPAEQLAGMRRQPFWRVFEAMAPTLDYDAAAVGDDGLVPVMRSGGVVSPTLVMSGTVTPFMREVAATVARAVPGAVERTLEGQRHDADPRVLAPALAEFFEE